MERGDVFCAFWGSPKSAERRKAREVTGEAAVTLVHSLCPAGPLHLRWLSSQGTQPPHKAFYSCWCPLQAKAMPALQHEACEQLLNLGEDWILAETNCLMLPPCEGLAGSPKQNQDHLLPGRCCVCQLPASPNRAAQPSKGDRWHGWEGREHLQSLLCQSKGDTNSLPWLKISLPGDLVSTWHLLSQELSEQYRVTFKLFSLPPLKLLLCTVKFK